MLSALRAINSELPSMLITITHRLYFLYSSLLCHHFSGSNVIASRPFRCAKVPLTSQTRIAPAIPTFPKQELPPVPELEFPLPQLPELPKPELPPLPKPA